MKKNSIILAAAFAFFAAACTDNIIPVEPVIPETPTVTYIKANADEDDTKASIDGTTGNFSWTIGDKIAVFTITEPYGYRVSNALISENINQNSAVFTFSGENVVEENKRVDFAIYPASLVSDDNIAAYHTKTNLALRLPSTYRLEQVEGEKSPVPMIAKNEPNGTLQFKQLCALLRVTVKDVPKQTKRLEFRFSNNVKVAGDFKLSNVTAGETPLSIDDSWSLSPYNTELGNLNIINVTMPSDNVFRDEVDINLPVPTIPAAANGYSKLTVTAYDSGDEALLTISGQIKSSGQWKPARKAARKMTAPLPVFSVGSAEKVVFAPGNLQWQYSSSSHAVNEEDHTKVSTGIYDSKSYNGGMFFFAAHQYDIAGVQNSPDRRIYQGTDGVGDATSALSYFDGTSDNNGLIKRIDLFLFASSGFQGNQQSENVYHYKPFAVCNTTFFDDKFYYGNEVNSIINTNYDWGVFNAIAKDQTGNTTYAPGVWGLLSSGEWEYLLNDRTTNAKQKRGFAIVHGRRGLIILPDNWTINPTDDPFVPFTGTISTSDSNPSITWTEYGDTEWAVMEAAGAVFLPAGGSIDPRANNAETAPEGNTVINWGNTDDRAEGYYWTATELYNSSMYKPYPLYYAFAYCLNFGTGTADNVTKSHWRFDKSDKHWGRSVRLVRRLN